MMSYNDAIVLLNEFEDYAKTHNVPAILDLIVNARTSLAKDFGVTFPPVQIPQTVSRHSGI